jgi:hypothetical protein
MSLELIFYIFIEIVCIVCRLTVSDIVILVILLTHINCQMVAITPELYLGLSWNSYIEFISE